MSRGPSKVSVRVDGEDSEAVAQEVVRTYADMLAAVSKLEESYLGEGT